MELDWSKCIICQQDIPEPLKCPLNSHKTGGEVFYSSFLANVKEFRSLDELPTSIYFKSDLTVNDFERHRASWHKSYHLKYSTSKLTRAKKRKANDYDGSERVPSKRQAMNIQNCIFCEKGSEEGDLHQVVTFDANFNIREMITALQDTQLLARIDGGDLIAKEAKYHLKCLVSLRNRYRSHKRKFTQELECTNEKMNESRVFIELITYIEKAVESGTLLFRLAELHSLYVNRLSDLGIRKLVNKTWLKLSLLQHFPEAQEQCDGKNTAIIFRKGMETMLQEALKKRDFSEDATILAKAAMIIRNDTFDHQCPQFNGSFLSKCQEDSLPSSLKSLISLILNGPNIKDQDGQEPQACLSVGQFILYNMKKTSPSGLKSRHTLDREPPLPIYIGLNIHRQTRSRKLITQLYCMGVSISYQRVLDLEDKVATSVCERFVEDGVVSSACLRKGIHTTSALNNLDHNPTSTTSQSSFHGTGISLFQFPTKDNPGEDRPPITLPLSGASKHYLPDSYAIVPAVSLKISDVDVPKLSPNVATTQSCLDVAISKEEAWVDHALALLEKKELR
jgi:hypothetical protein